MSSPARRLPPFILRFGNRYRFEFTVETPRLTRAVCYGRTMTEFESLPGRQIQNFFPEETGRARFPNAEPFTTVEAAQNECDRWRIILSSRYHVPIRTMSGGMVMDWRDESKDTIELKNFLRHNEAELSLWRDSHKPDNSLNYLAEHGTMEQRAWVLALKCKQVEFDDFTRQHDIDTVVRKLASVKRYLGLLDSPLVSLTEATSEPAIKNSCGYIRAHGLTIETQCEKLVSAYETLKRELDTLKANRP